MLTQQTLNDLWFARTEPQNVTDLSPFYTACEQEACLPAAIPALVVDLFPKADTPIWYYRTFHTDLTPDDTHRIWLCFEQVVCLCQVWVNGICVGKHIHSEEKFAFDITHALRAGENLIACRVYGPVTGKVGPEGIAMDSVPNFAQIYSFYTVVPKTGIYGSVSLRKKPVLSAEDLYIRPDPDTARVHVELTLNNRLSRQETAHVICQVFDRDEPVREEEYRWDVGPEATQTVSFTVPMENIRLWSPDDPWLYTMHLSVRSACGAEHMRKRFGFKSLRVENGYFMLNGQRIWLPGAHTQPGKDAVVHAKAMGLKMLRYLSGMPSEEVLDFCDEVGMLVYEESAASWGMTDYPDMPTHMAAYLSNMVRRDRNHVCVGVWGLFNEQAGPNPGRKQLSPSTSAVFDFAVAYLPELRRLDSDRLILLSSGRWDACPQIGSYSNPGSDHWEYGWGGEGPDAAGTAENLGITHDPYITMMGDNHLYPLVPLQPYMVDFVRRIGAETNPVFLSEYGVGYQLELYDLLIEHLQNSHPDHPMSAYYNAQVRHMEEWIRLYGLEHIYPAPRDFLMASIKAGAKQRRESIDPIRANPKICGYSFTSFSTGNEGVYFRKDGFIPGITDALRDSFAPLKWSVFMDRTQLYANQPCSAEIVLCNSGALPAGAYSANAAVWNENGVAWRETVKFVYPEDMPLAATAAKIQIPGLPAGRYTLSLYLNGQLQPTCGEKIFTVHDLTLPALKGRIFPAGDLDAAMEWLARYGVTAADTPDEADLICVGRLPETEEALQARREEILALARQGHRVLILDDGFWASANTSQQRFMQGVEYEGGSDGNIFGERIFVKNWLYHMDNYIADSAVFAGLSPMGLVDMDTFRFVYPDQYMVETEAPGRTFCAAFGSGVFARDGCIAALTMGEFPFGKGHVVVNTFKILDYIDTDPVADRLLYNLISVCLR